MFKKIINKIIFTPPKCTKMPKCAEQVYIKEIDTYVDVIFLFRPGSKKLLLVSHDTHEDVTSSYATYRSLGSILKMNVCVYSYPGYGKSKEKMPTEENCYLAGYATLRWLRAKNNIEDTHEIILFGRGLGTGPACELAKMNCFAGLILVNPIKSVARIHLDTNFPVIPGDRFVNQEKIIEIKIPILIIFGMKNKIIPPEHSVALYKKRPCKTTLSPIRNRGHSDLHFDREYYLAILNWLACLWDTQ